MKLIKALMQMPASEREQSVLEWMYKNNPLWELRKRAEKREHRLSVRDDGSHVKDHHLPHVPIDAQVYARTWRAFKTIQKHEGYASISEMWEKWMLPRMESAAKLTRKERGAE